MTPEYFEQLERINRHFLNTANDFFDEAVIPRIFKEIGNSYYYRKNIVSGSQVGVAVTECLSSFH